MKVLLTGATGCIGRSLLRYKPADCDIELLLSPTSLQLPGFAWYRADVSVFKKTRMAITCSCPDVVVHLAALSSPDRCELEPDRARQVNTDGAEHVARACRECGARMVLFSTDHVFDGAAGPYSETDRPKPVNVYGQAKLDAEHAAAAVVSDLLVIRIAFVIGKRGVDSPHNFLSSLIEQLRAGTPVKVWKDQHNTPAYLEELSQVFWMLIRKKVTGIVHYGTSDRLTRYDMACKVCEIMELPESLVEPVKVSDQALPARRPRESGFITEKVHDILGMPPTTFTNALLHMTETP